MKRLLGFIIAAVLLVSVAWPILVRTAQGQTRAIGEPKQATGRITVDKQLILPGTRGKELWIGGDTYAKASGPEMVGIQSFAEETDEDGQTSSGVRRVHSGRSIRCSMRRSSDNGRTWRLDAKPFWELTPDADDHLYGYIEKSLDGFLLDQRRDTLVRLSSSKINFGPAYYGAGSPAYRQNRVFYEVSRDGGRTWSLPRQVIAERSSDAQGSGHFWLDWAPGVRWGYNGGFFYTGTRLQLADGTMLTGFCRWRAGTGVADECAVVKIRWREDAPDTLAFDFGQFLTISPDISEKGVSEPSFAFLDDGWLLVVLRAGGNSKKKSPARRYYALSKDLGRTWAPLEELKFDDGASMNVPESMSHVIRSSRTNKVYWIGNLNEEPTWDCYPRNRLVIAELDQAKLAVRRDTVTVIDQSPRGKGEMRYSNYVLYEDRFSKDLVAVMPELAAAGEKAAPDHVSNGYRYTIRVD